MNRTINDYPEVSRRTIWNFRQNSPELVVRDLRDYLGLNEEQCQFVRTVLLARGINKWLKVRRDIIAYKKQIRNEIKDTEQARAKEQPTSLKRKELLVRSKTLQSVRCTLKQLCMTDRWQPWPKDKHIKEGIRTMNTIKASDIIKVL